MKKKPAPSAEAKPPDAPPKEIKVTLDYRKMPPKITREQWITGMRKRHPAWEPRTAEDLAQWVEAYWGALGLLMDDWSHARVEILQRQERDDRYDEIANREWGSKNTQAMMTQYALAK